MTIAKVSLPSDAEILVLGHTNICLNALKFSPIPDANTAQLTWLGSGGLILFSEARCTVALIRVVEVITQGSQRLRTRTRSCMVSLTLGTDRFLVTAVALSDGSDVMAAALRRDILYTELRATPDQVIDALRIIAEYSVYGVHDGNQGQTWMRLQPAPTIASIAQMVTNRSRPVGVGLLLLAPASAWVAQFTAEFTCIRPNGKVAHLFLVQHATPALLAAMRDWSVADARPNYPFESAFQLSQFTQNECDAWRLLLKDAAHATQLVNSGRAGEASALVEHILLGTPLK